MRTSFLLSLFLVLTLFLSGQPAGTLDPDFGNNGRSLYNFSNQPTETLLGVMEQSDGKVVVMGTTNLWSGGSVIVARFLTSGTLDTDFAENGYRILSYGGTTFMIGSALQADDKILVSGSAANTLITVRLTAEGDLDSSFAGDGVLQENLPDAQARANAIVVQPDGKIVTAGYVQEIGEAVRAFLVNRYLPDGTLDTDFGEAGRAVLNIDFDSSVNCNAVNLQADGKILVSGKSRNAGHDFATYRLLPDGTLDTTFDEDGAVFTSMGTADEDGWSIHSLSDGSILLGGRSVSTSTTHTDFALVKYLENGELDTDFGDGGTVRTNMPGSSASLFRIHPLPDGKILATGTARNGSLGHDLALVRYLPDGSLDPDFGDDGISLTDFNGATEWLYATIISSNGSIVGVGQTDDTSSGNQDALLVSFFGEDQPDFNVAGSQEGDVYCVGDTTDLVLSVSTLAGYNEEVTITAENLPSGASFITPLPLTITPPQEVPLQLIFSGTPGGDYSFNLVASSNGVQKSVSYQVTVINEAPQAAVLDSPQEGEVFEIGAGFLLDWSPTSAYTTYQVEVSTNPSFSASIVFTESTETTAAWFSTSDYEAGIYYYRVSSILCGATVYSETTAFRLVPAACDVVYASGLPLRISIVEPDTAMVTINLADGIPADVENFRVYFQTDHARLGDLSATLQSPDGISLTLFDRPGVPASSLGCDRFWMRVTFDDLAPNDAEALENTCGPGTPAIEGDFQALGGNLNDFLSESGVGDWVLTVTDPVENFGGFLSVFSFEFCGPPTLIPELTIETNEVIAPEGSEIVLGNTQLFAQASDGSEPLFVLRTLPQFGALLLAGELLVVGDTITQQAIDQGTMSYQHLNDEPGMDSFQFDVVTSTGAWLNNQLLDIIITPINSLEQIDNHNALVLFPNPTTSVLQLRLRTVISEPLRLSLYNTQGQQMLELDELPHQLDVRSYPAGVYWLQLTTKDGTQLYPIVVQK